ncbi:MAG: 4Fe-4S ferredoxin [Thermodesulfatator sp.]|nr:MAG: 4Fe-4S ferredoxin [Thermodesulfatator sp.]
MTLQASKLNPEFVEEIIPYQGCETVTLCYSCGSCSGVCPVEKVVDDFDPRKIVHMVAMGMEDSLINGEIIWACSQCQSCIPVCPQNVRCADVIKALRDEAVKRHSVDGERLRELGQFAVVDGGKCVACLTCVRLCPFGAPRIIDEGYAVIEAELCHACGICVLECPAEAISLAPSLEARGALK